MRSFDNKIKASIDMYEVTTAALRAKDKRGRAKRFVWVSTIGPVMKLHPSEKSASNYLYKIGFRLNDKLEYEHTAKSDFLLYLELHYRKVF